MKKNLVIIGAGPRGLAVALRASIEKKYNVYVVDSNPMSSWQFPNMLPDMEMRSPISFDLTTFCKDLHPYSLSSFLGNPKYYEDQEEVEASNTYCFRLEFIKYLEYIIKICRQNGVVFVKKLATNITDKDIMCGDTPLSYDYLVVATGKKSQHSNIPSYLRGNKVETIKSISSRSWKKDTITVIGSGQQSAELVAFLALQKARVFWALKHTPKVNQYPVPSYSNWGFTSALGNYYRDYCVDKNSYLKRVKEWMPSITPYINNQLNKLSYTKILNPISTEDLEMNGYFVIAAGSQQRVELIDFNFEIEKDRHVQYLPRLEKGFKSTSHPNIFFTGLLAARFDGPRQGSIISSAITAKEILDNIPT